MEPDLDAKLAAALERAGQAIRVQMWERAGRHGLSPTQLQVLLRLAGDPPARRRIGALAAELDVTHATVSGAVAALRRRGLVEREAASRRAALALAGRGRALAAELAGWDEPVRRELALLPDAGKEAALALLVDLIAALQRSGTITVARMCTTCRSFRRDAHPGAVRRHHCALIDAPLADRDLRVDCPEHQRLVAVS
jgi:DNA-binding MarR family transcriptional regulator